MVIISKKYIARHLKNINLVKSGVDNREQVCPEKVRNVQWENNPPE
jgi:hypothetical protein